MIIWYSVQFGFNTSRDQDLEAPLPTAARAAALFVFSALAPLEGALYFWVFLVMRPAAYNHLKKRLQSLFLALTCRSPNYNSDCSSSITSDDERVRSGLFSISVPHTAAGDAAASSGARASTGGGKKQRLSGRVKQLLAAERGSVYNVEGIGARLSQGDSSHNYAAASAALRAGSHSINTTTSSSGTDDQAQVSSGRKERHGKITKQRQRLTAQSLSPAAAAAAAAVDADAAVDEERGTCSLTAAKGSQRVLSTDSCSHRSGGSLRLFMDRLSWTGSHTRSMSASGAGEAPFAAGVGAEHLLDDDELVERINNSFFERQRNSELASRVSNSSTGGADSHVHRESELVRAGSRAAGGSRGGQDAHYVDNPISSSSNKSKSPHR